MNIQNFSVQRRSPWYYFKMHNHFDICLTHKEIKRFPRKDLENEFMNVQEKVFKQNEEMIKKDQEIIKKDQEIIKKDQEIQELKEELNHLKKDVESKGIQEVNKLANEPSSKKPEWDKDGNPKKKGKKQKKKNGGSRKGSGNKKKNLTPDEKNTTPLDTCPECGEDLEDRIVYESPSRIIEDLPDTQQAIVYQETTEKKWCPICQKIVSSKSEKGLPSSDYGLNTMTLCAYFWVITAISLPNISKYLMNFFRMPLSTSGISKMMCRLGDILTPVYEEILQDVKSGSCIWADETGWRIRGQLHWLWAFANKKSAYYWVDKSRGSDVVNRILGDIFSGVLITDAWSGYFKIESYKQTCMAHIFRKIRKFIDAHPDYRSILKFYIKLRRILRDAQKLKENREELGEFVFKRRLDLLKSRLSEILKWKNPNSILKEVIAKVKRQQEYILTFVEHKDATSHNNYAEYIIKKGVLKRKISGGSMSMKGAKAYSILISIGQTCHLRGLSFHGFLKDSLLEYIRTGKPMSLSKYELTQEQQRKAV